MSTEAPAKAEFSRRGYNPDVLTCIANLSNDEVFTPPELTNQMLDTLAEGWAEANGGESIWADASVTFLDPFTKSGVFLREITRRLVDGLAEQIPDLQERVDHILTKQVFGIGITSLTALLARRSVYCSKYANGPHSVAKSFDRDWGNVWFERTEHTWAGARCVYCPAQRERFDRPDDLETHAYAFIHTSDIKARLARMFGADMQFDVIIGNPPYQMAGGAGGSSDSSIYQLFVEQAMKLEPRLLSMVIPSRWMAGGRGLDAFREQMLNSQRLRSLIDFPDASDAFPGVQVKGGVCYFLWDAMYKGRTTLVRVAAGERHTQLNRDLGEFDVLVRDERAVAILRKVLSLAEPSIVDSVSADTPFGIATNFQDFADPAMPNSIALHHIVRGQRSIARVARTVVRKNATLVDSWKVLVPEAYGAGEAIPHQILGRAIVASPPSACTQSYLAVGPFKSRQEAESFAAYYRTRFFRFIVSLRKITQHALRSTYTWVPRQSWDRAWTDEELYAKYGLTDDEVRYMESQIKPMELGDV